VKGFDVGLIGGRGRALRRHLERRGPETMAALVEHFVNGRHQWSGEELGQALDELEDTGITTAPDDNGYVHLTVRPPL
jgi:hypothetical protein